MKIILCIIIRSIIYSSLVTFAHATDGLFLDKALHATISQNFYVVFDMFQDLEMQKQHPKASGLGWESRKFNELRLYGLFQV
jgi:hypothetical protein